MKLEGLPGSRNGAGNESTRDHIESDSEKDNLVASRGNNRDKREADETDEAAVRGDIISSPERIPIFYQNIKKKWSLELDKILNVGLYCILVRARQVAEKRCEGGARSGSRKPGH